METRANASSLAELHNRRFNWTGQQLLCWLPSSLRSSAAGYAQRWQSRINAIINKPAFLTAKAAVSFF
jgi:hypothetical protein